MNVQFITEKIAFLEFKKNPNTLGTWFKKKKKKWSSTFWSWFSWQSSRTKEYRGYFLCWKLFSLCSPAVLLCFPLCTSLPNSKNFSPVFQSRLVYPFLPGVSSWFTAFSLMILFSCNFLTPQTLFHLNYSDILSWNLKVMESCPSWRLFQGLARNDSFFFF